VNNHDFTQKNHIFSNCGGRYENVWGISCEKSRFYAQKSYFFQLRREARKFLGYFVWTITILRQKILFFPIAEGGANIFGVFRVKITILRPWFLYNMKPARPWMLAHLKIIWQFHAHPVHQKVSRFFGDDILLGPNLVSFNRAVVPYEISKVNFRVETKFLFSMSEEIY
jgi:hypothetical protein